MLGLFGDVSLRLLQRARTYALNAVPLCPPDRHSGAPFLVRDRRTATFHALHQPRDVGRGLEIRDHVDMRADNAQRQQQRSFLLCHGRQVRGEECCGSAVEGGLAIPSGPHDVHEQSATHSRKLRRPPTRATTSATQLCSIPTRCPRERNWSPQRPRRDASTRGNQRVESASAFAPGRFSDRAEPRVHSRESARLNQRVVSSGSKPLLGSTAEAAVSSRLAGPASYYPDRHHIHGASAC